MIELGKQEKFGEALQTIVEFSQHNLLPLLKEMIARK